MYCKYVRNNYLIVLLHLFFLLLIVFHDFNDTNSVQSQDGKYIASGAIDGFINVFDVASGKLVHTIEGHAMTIRSIAFSPDSQLLLTAADDGHMKLYDL